VPDHVEMAVGDGIKRAGIKRDAGHKAVYRAPGDPASRAGSGAEAISSALYFHRPLNHFGAERVSSKDRPVFLPAIGDETKLRCDETIFASGEDIRKPALTIH
jgi:hypothetical protein